MTFYLDLLLFCIFPYAAVAVALYGCVKRFRTAPLTWKTGSTQFLESRILRWGSILFHIGMIGLLLGHMGGLLVPHQVYEFLGISLATKQKIEITMGLIMTPVAVIGCAILIWRRFVDERVRAASSWGDVVMLSALLAQSVLGFLTIPQSFHHLDGSMLGHIMGYTVGLVVFDPAAMLNLTDVPWIYKFHMVAGYCFILALPFTRLVHVLSGFIILRYIVRPWQVVSAGFWKRPV
jgi:nitrate reductase gamma subunit